MEGSVTTTSMLRPLVDDLHARREQARLGGGEEKVAKQHAAGKLTARERLDLLMDQPQAPRHVRDHPAHRRRRALVRPQASMGQTVVEEGTGYVVSFAALEQRWDDYAELAEASLLSLSTE